MLTDSELKEGSLFDCVRPESRSTTALVAVAFWRMNSNAFGDASKPDCVLFDTLVPSKSSPLRARFEALVPKLASLRERFKRLVTSKPASACECSDIKVIFFSPALNIAAVVLLSLALDGDAVLFLSPALNVVVEVFSSPALNVAAVILLSSAADDAAAVILSPSLDNAGPLSKLAAACECFVVTALLTSSSDGADRTYARRNRRTTSAANRAPDSFSIASIFGDVNLLAVFFHFL
ncbi:hypothetical protein V8C35DRAFT_27668 [Trichoderma chlorosporum]